MMVIKKMLTRRIAEIKRLIVFVIGVRNLTATRMATMSTAWPARRIVVFMVMAVIAVDCLLQTELIMAAIYFNNDARPMRIASWGPRSRKSDPRPDMLTRRLKHGNTRCCQSGSVRSCTIRLKKDPLLAWFCTDAP